MLSRVNSNVEISAVISIEKAAGTRSEIETYTSRTGQISWRNTENQYKYAGISFPVTKSSLVVYFK
jgi:hypothetical protein